VLVLFAEAVFEPAPRERPFASMVSSAVSLRALTCAVTSCGAVFLLCTRCYRGQRYCSETCAHAARNESMRSAGRRYQRTREGQRGHADRQRAYRQRQKVTHQGSRGAAAAVRKRTRLNLGGATREPSEIRLERANHPSDGGELPGNPGGLRAGSGSGAQRSRTMPWGDVVARHFPRASVDLPIAVCSRCGRPGHVRPP
jgi:hypothetical protein